jgi:predicted nucleic acid-binding protein
MTNKFVVDTNVIVTGDLDLLVLNPFQAVEIVTPDIFIDRFS